MIKTAFNIFRFISSHPLCRDRKFNSFLRFLRWQIFANYSDSKKLINWVDDTKFTAQKGETGLTGNIYCGFMEFEDMSFVLHFLRRDDEFYDIGANVGAYTILASGVIGCKTFSFEPLPETFDKLKDQIKINSIEHLVKTFNKGLGSENGSLEFTNLLNCMNHVNTDPKNTNVTVVEVLTLDETFYPVQPSLVKIDVEGYEAFVINGGKEFFSNENVLGIIIEINGSGKQFGILDEDLDNTLRAHNFKPISYDPFNRNIRVSNYSNEGNTIYLKDIEGAQTRCKDSEFYNIHTADNIKI